MISGIIITWRTGTSKWTLKPSADWWDAAAVQWAVHLSRDPIYDADVEGVIAVAEVLDAVYEI